jgi:aquaporin Z
VTAGAYAVGPISGAAFNPAVTVAVLLLGIVDAGTAIIMIVTQLIAAAIAALTFNGLGIAIDKPTTATAAEQTALRGAAEPGA